jgi:predicted dehydrogenase
MSVGVGIVGAGIFGRRHAQAYAGHPDARLLAICDIQRDRAEALASQFGGTVYTDVASMLRHPGLEAVSVVTPDQSHREVAVAAARAGKHVLVEKPLATSVEDAQAIIDAARQHGVRLMVDFHNRWNPPFCAARDAIQADQIGRVKYVYMRLHNAITVPKEMLRWAGGSSVIWFLGSHCLDLLRWLLEDEVERVTAVAGSGVLTGQGVETDDYVVATLEFSSGARATLEHCWILPPGGPTIKDFKCEIIGERGAIYVDTSHNESLVIVHPKGTNYPDLFAAPLVGGRVDGFVMKSIWHFVECLRDGRDPAVTGTDGLRVTEAGVAILTSAREGRAVSVELGRG